jgi:hypothetical protein
MDRILRRGSGWRLGWEQNATEYSRLVGSDDWALELTITEFEDFCRLTEQLAATMQTMQAELMDEEAIACEVESESIWLEAKGYPHHYSLHLILLSRRRGEGCWAAAAVPELLQALRSPLIF